MASARAGFIGGWAWALLPLSSCIVQDVDLRRTPPGDVGQAGDELTCPPGERRDPTTGLCEPCTSGLPPPIEVCPCSWEILPTASVDCPGDVADYICVACPPDGNIDDCAAVASDDSVRDCEQLRACCDQLVLSPTPCCEHGRTLACVEQPGGVWNYTYECEP